MVAGKFIAAAVLILVMVALAGIFPLILVIFGNPEIGVMASGYLGLAFLGVSFVAVGMFTSSVTQNQIIAAISCFGALLLLYVISWPAETGGGTFSSLLRYLSLPEHFANDGARYYFHQGHCLLLERRCGRLVSYSAGGRIGALALAR